MTAVLASYVKMSTLVDGTMRIVLDVEPKSAAEAFQLLGAPGTAIALARITNEAAVAHDRRQQETTGDRAPVQGDEVSALGHPEASRPATSSLAPNRKPLPLSSLCALRCRELTFDQFLRSTSSGLADLYRDCETYVDVTTPYSAKFTQADVCAEVVRRHCKITSRADLNTDVPAQDIWLGLEASYLDWQRRRAA